MILNVLITIAIITSLKISINIIDIFFVKKYLYDYKNTLSVDSKNILIAIPAIREQKTVMSTLDYFTDMSCNNINLYIVIAGTKREAKVKGKLTTIEIVNRWIKDNQERFKENVKCYYCEANDLIGDRATQLNYAIEFFKNTERDIPIDIIGLYDVDSLPSKNTLLEVAYAYFKNKDLCACQQPVHFISAANRMAKNKSNPILVANAIYQSTWTIIRELPSWIRYANHKTKSPLHKSIYLIGHGQFISYKDYCEFKFPEYEVTDGIQLGYRLGMLNKKVVPLHEFCNDDVPQQSISQLITQHKRWFGGAMNLLSAYKWVKEHHKINSWFQVIDGCWSQFCWAFATPVILLSILISSLINLKLALFFLILVVVYCFLIPFLSLNVFSEKIKVRFIDWLCIPLAIFIKCLGPNKYFINKLFGKKIYYNKVER